MSVIRAGLGFLTILGALMLTTQMVAAAPPAQELDFAYDASAHTLTFSTQGFAANLYPTIIVTDLKVDGAIGGVADCTHVTVTVTMLFTRYCSFSGITSVKSLDAAVSIQDA